MAGKQDDVEQILSYWMTEVELLTVKRRYRQGTSWEPRKDWLTTVKRRMGVGGRKYAFTRVRETIVRVQRLEDDWCHVALICDVSNMRAERVGAGALFLGAGSAMAAITVVLGVASGVTAIPVVVGTAGGWAIARSNRPQVERVQVSMERVLDRLERGEINLPKESPLKGGGEFVKRLKAEIKELGKNLGA